MSLTEMWGVKNISILCILYVSIHKIENAFFKKMFEVLLKVFSSYLSAINIGHMITSKIENKRWNVKKKKKEMIEVAVILVPLLLLVIQTIANVCRVQC